MSELKTNLLHLCLFFQRYFYHSEFEERSHPFLSLCRQGVPFHQACWACFWLCWVTGVQVLVFENPYMADRENKALKCSVFFGF